ncbi:vesicular integral-membrane protein VIP36 isoform X2 [Belonocnema kinseyi]|uniref:vesicular integral-membrane protein VIP36 isoform X2 n=1 Tax=Belonocnema kinseyi TaxID=2817044 RepID=UPI00143D04D3|nr:vesicular integral-membrane protein VIP36 isoform X2 [Belonocnema kinseyi]
MGENSQLIWCYVFLIGVLNVLGAEWNTNDYMKREHSLVRPYQGSGMTMPYWDFMGSTIVTNNYIRLTPDLQSKQGAIWNSIPVNVRNWELQVHFKVHGKGRELFGDGLAIWYAKDRMQEGPVFGNKDFFQGLGIILDTYSNHNGPHNHQHPYISAMINNGTLHYDHDRDGTHTQLAGCEAKFRNLEQDTLIAVRYERDTLTVSTIMGTDDKWKECLSVKGIKLPTGYYFGMSATTGDLSDNHDILSVRMFEIDLPNEDNEDRASILPSATFFEAPREHVEDPKPAPASGIKTFFAMLLCALVIIVFVIIAIMVYQKRAEQSRKRLY